MQVDTQVTPELLLPFCHCGAKRPDLDLRRIGNKPSRHRRDCTAVRQILSRRGSDLPQHTPASQLWVLGASEPARVCRSGHASPIRRASRVRSARRRQFVLSRIRSRCERTVLTLI